MLWLCCDGRTLRRSQECAPCSFIAISHRWVGFLVACSAFALSQRLVGQFDPVGVFLCGNRDGSEVQHIEISKVHHQLIHDRRQLHCILEILKNSR